MKVFAVITLLIFCSMGMARDAGFYDLGGAIVEIGSDRLANAYDATFQIDTEKITPEAIFRDRATGFFISNDGYFLTVLHGILLCTEENMKVDHILGNHELLTDIYTVKDPRKEIVCQETVIHNEAKDVTRISFPKPTLVLTGKYLFDGDFFEMLTPEFRDYLSNFNSGDFAILKVNSPVPTSCIPLASSSNIKVGDNISAIGFPMSAYRGKLSSKTGNKYVTIGHIARFPRRDLFGVYAPQARLAVSLFKQDSFFSNLDLVSGLSGSPVVDSEGNALGMSIIGSGGGKYFAGEAIHFKSDSLYKAVVNLVGKEKAKTYFNCPKIN